jgi:hypothetical protein
LGNYFRPSDPGIEIGSADLQPDLIRIGP